MTTQSKTSFTVNTSRREVVMERIFDAPRELVYQTYIDPDLVPRWWGPARLTTMVEVMEVRPGGEWRFIQCDAEGNTYAFRGRYQEVIPPERLVYTFIFEDAPDSEVLETVTFEDLGQQTRVVAVDTFKSEADLKGMVSTGMEQGALESFERFAGLLQALQSGRGRAGV